MRKSRTLCCTGLPQFFFPRIDCTGGFVEPDRLIKELRDFRTWRNPVGPEALLLALIGLTSDGAIGRLVSVEPTSWLATSAVEG